MDSLNRAKRFLAQKASKLALAAIPLAALAVCVPAHAGAILETPVTCTVASGIGTCSAVSASAAGGDPDLNWIQMAGGGAAAYNSGSGLFELDFAVDGSGNSGSISAGTIPVSWDFQLTNSGGASINWGVQFMVIENNSFEYVFSGGGSSSGGTILGSGSINIPSGSITAYALSLSTNSSGSYSAVIPGLSTLDLNSGSTGVPEPSTILLTSIGGIALLFRRRKKKTS